MAEGSHKHYILQLRYWFLSTFFIPISTILIYYAPHNCTGTWFLIDCWRWNDMASWAFYTGNKHGELYNPFWNLWRWCGRVFWTFRLVFEVHKVANDSKVAHLLSGISPKTYSVLKNLTLPAECELQWLKTLLVQHYKPKPLVIAEHFAFHKSDQCIAESINDFIIELRKLAQSYSF